MNRTILRAEGIIQNRITALEQKIEHVKERWPEDMYGLKYLEKIDKYEVEIKELREYLNAKKNASAMMNRSEQGKRELFRSKLMLNEIRQMLVNYGEYAMAEKLERELKSIEETYGYSCG